MVGDKAFKCQFLILKITKFPQITIKRTGVFYTRFFLLILVGIACGSFSNKHSAFKAWHLSGYGQGTTYHITYYSAAGQVSSKQVDSILSEIDSSLSLYKSYSLINKFNNSASGVTVDDHFKRVVKRSVEIFCHTQGVFDVTVKPLVQAWGFGVKPISAWPDSARVNEILQYVGSDKIHLKGHKLIKDDPAVQVDLNGIAQGYSVDLLAEFLEKKNIRNYLVELGGEIRIRGRKQPGGQLMQIGIEAPDDNQFESSPVKRIIALDKGAITTSGNYRKFHMAGNKKISHLIDPKTGYSINNELISVTVYARDAISADGYDNALMGMGLKNALTLMEKRKEMGAYFIYHKPDGSVADTATAYFPEFTVQAASN